MAKYKDVGIGDVVVVKDKYRGKPDKHREGKGNDCTFVRNENNWHYEQLLVLQRDRPNLPANDTRLHVRRVDGGLFWGKHTDVYVCPSFVRKVV